ncbi:reverse transcriptase domain-containing protein [Tanacetum coccineum]
MMKFPTPWGVATIVSQTPVVFECRRQGKKQTVEPPENVKTQDNVSPIEQVLINPAFPEQLVVIGKDLSLEGSTQLKNLLKKNIDIFAWEPSNMTGVPKRIIKHSLNANPSITPVSQKRRVFCSKKSQVVRKADGSWRMCIDFKNINSACPKDYYPLPEIDSKIEAVMGFPLKCFMDAYKGYHQNARATYQRLVDEAFQSQIGKNLEVYVDDMVVKSKSEREMLADIVKTFNNLWRINMKLNPKKCSFRVTKGKFLGYMVTLEGIRANPTKMKDIAEMQSPKTWGKMQSLVGKLAALNHFLSRPAEKSLPFFETLKGITKENKQDYRWTEKAKNAFQELKKTTLDLLRRYFEDHPITVITDQPIKQVLNKADTSGRLAPYFVELAAYNITYEPRSAIKGQVLADFINEIPVGGDAVMPRKTQYTFDHDKDCKEEWVIYTDGASSAKGSDASLVLISLTKTEYTYAVKLNFKSTNNQAEYEALLAGLRIAKKMGVQSLSVYVDSKLVASQINGNYEACKESMIWYLSMAKEYISCFKIFKIQNIPRNKNQKADVLSKLASVAFNHLTKEVLVETLDMPSTDMKEINAVVEEEGETWMTSIINCLKTRIWPEDKHEARILRMKIGQYIMEEGVLFKISYIMPTL